MALTKDFKITVSVEANKGDFKDLTEGAKEFSESVKDVSTNLKKVGDSTSGASLKFTEFNNAIELAQKAFNALVGPIKESVNAFIEAEKAESNLKNALVALGFDAEGAMQDFQSFAKEIQRTTTVSDDFALELAGMGKSLGLTNDMTKQMIKTSIGLSTAMGVDVRTAFNDLAGQLQGVAGRSAKYVSGLKDLTEKQLKAGEGIKLTADQYERFATLSTNSLAGALAQSKNAFEDIYEAVGKLISDLVDMPAMIRSSTEAFIAIVDVVEELGARLEVVKEAFRAIPFEEVKASLIAITGALAGAIAIMNAPAIGAFLVTLQGVAVTAVIVAAKFILIAGAILAVTVVVETLIENFGNLKVIGAVVLDSLRIGAEYVALGFKNLSIAVLESFSKIMTPLSSYSSVAAAMVENLNATVATIKVSAEGSRTSIDNLGNSLKNSLGDVKTGSILNGIVKGVAALKKGFDPLPLAIKKAKVEFNDFSKQRLTKSIEDAKELKKKIDDLISDIKKLEDQTINLRREEEKRGKSAAEIARLDEKYALEAAANLRQRMKDLGLEDEKLQQIIASYEEAIRIRAKAQIEEAQKAARKKAEDDIGSAKNPLAREAGRAALDIGDAISEAIVWGMNNSWSVVKNFFQRNFRELTQEQVNDLAVNVAHTLDSFQNLLAGIGAAIGYGLKDYDNFLRGAADTILGALESGADYLEANFWYGFITDLNNGTKEMVAELRAGMDAANNALADTMEDINKSIYGTKKDEKGAEVAAGSILDDITKGFTVAGKIMGKAIDQAIDSISYLASGELVKDLAAEFKDLSDLPGMFFDAFSELGTTISSFIENFPAIMEKLLKQLPKIIQKIGEQMPQFFDMIARAIPLIAKAFADAIPVILQGILDALPKLIEAITMALRIIIQAIPEIVNQIMKALPSIITSLFDAIPQLFAEIFKAIPTIFENLMEGLPDIILALVDGFISAMGEIVGAFIDEFLIGGGLERIVGAFLRAIPRIAIAFVQGVVRGLVNALVGISQGIFGDIKLPEIIEELPHKIETAADDLGKKIAKEASQIFSVKSLEDAADGIPGSQTPEDFWEQSKKGASDFFSYLGDKWHVFMKWLESVWNNFVNMLAEVWKGILTGFDMLLASFENIGELVGVFARSFGPAIEKLLETLAGIFSQENINRLGKVFGDIWRGITTASEMLEEVGQNLLDLFSLMFENFGQIGQNLVDAIQNAFSLSARRIQDSLNSILSRFGMAGVDIWKGFTNAFSGTNVFTNMGGQIWSGLFSGLQGLGKFFQDTLNSISPGNLLQKMFAKDNDEPGPVEKALSRLTGQDINVPWVRFAKGGIVPGDPLVGGDSVLNDRIVALLSPGEAVIPRTKMQDPTIKKIVEMIMNGDFKPPMFKNGMLDRAEKEAGNAGGAVSSTVGGVVQSAKDAYKSGQDAAQQLEQAANDAGGYISDKYKEAVSWLEQFDPSKLWEKLKEKGMASFKPMMDNAPKFHTGGLVPAFAGGGEVPAILQPGEFVVQRKAVNGNFGALSSINNTGKIPGATSGGGNITIEKIEINARTNLDAETIRREVIPALHKDLKRRSNDGEFVISAKGVR